MEAKAKIKVIRRADKPLPIGKKRREKVKTAASTAREMVTTVSGWVAEFQQKRRDETKDALEKLFAPTPDQTGLTNC